MAYQIPPSLTDGMKKTDVGAIQSDLINLFQSNPTLLKKELESFTKGS